MITAIDIRNIEICHKPFWVKRFNKMFPKGSRLNKTNLIKFFHYTKKDKAIIKRLNAGSWCKEFNIKHALSMLTKRLGTRDQKYEVENIAYTYDNDPILTISGHKDLFNRFFEALKRSEAWG